MVSRIIARLVADPPKAAQEDALQGQDPSYDLCLAAWVVQLLQTEGSTQDEDSDYDTLDTRTVIISLMNNLGPATPDSISQHKAYVSILQKESVNLFMRTHVYSAKLLLKELCKDKPELAETYTRIVSNNHSNVRTLSLLSAT